MDELTLVMDAYAQIHKLDKDKKEDLYADDF